MTASTKGWKLQYVIIYQTITIYYTTLAGRHNCNISLLIKQSMWSKYFLSIQINLLFCHTRTVNFYVAQTEGNCASKGLTRRANKWNCWHVYSLLSLGTLSWEIFTLKSFFFSKPFIWSKHLLFSFFVLFPLCEFVKEVFLYENQINLKQLELCNTSYLVQLKKFVQNWEVW